MTELETAQQRIAELEAELAAMRVVGEPVGWVMAEVNGNLVLDSIEKTERGCITGMQELGFSPDIFRLKPTPLYTHPSPPEGMAGWKLIETAPKDGTSFLGHWQGGKYDFAIRAVKFYNGKWWEPNEDYLVREPTHWMPLPAPPLASEAKGAT